MTIASNLRDFNMQSSIITPSQEPLQEQLQIPFAGSNQSQEQQQVLSQTATCKFPSFNPSQEHLQKQLQEQALTSDPLQEPLHKTTTPINPSFQNPLQ